MVGEKRAHHKGRNDLNFRRKLRQWWQVRTRQEDTPLDGDVPFWLFSLALHLAVLIALARIFIPIPGYRDMVVTVDAPEEEKLEAPQMPPEIHFDDLPADEIGADSDKGSEAAFSQAIEFSEVPEIDTAVDLELRVKGELEYDNTFMEQVATDVAAIPVKGSVGQAVSGAAGAVDRITEEIILSLRERRTLVVWMFDQSASLDRQRNEITSRFDRIYEELGLLAEAGSDAFTKHEDKPLLTQVYAFGSNVSAAFKRPTDDLDEIKKAVRSIQTDESGIENVFAAVNLAANEYRNLRRISSTTGDRERNVMIIVVSDEAGDDIDNLDAAVHVCKKYEMPVFVIGVPAPFGRTETQVKYVDPDPNFDQSIQWLPVRQGPESLYPERLKLNFSNSDDRFDLLDSGFGPFGLTRLAYETGGIYFSVHPGRDQNRLRRGNTEEYTAFLSKFFDPKLMRRYRPDYVSVSTYRSRLEANKARFALVQAATQSWVTSMEPPTLRFEKLNEANFINTVSQAQRAAASLEPKINRLYEILRVGEEDRDEMVTLRWKANFDLAMGRVLATKIRAESYNAMLAMAKTTLKFKDPKNNTWLLRPADEISTGSQSKKLAEKAKFYLNRVIEEHPDTPWAMIAKKELSTPIGWKWVESYTEPPAPRRPRQPNVNNNNNNVPRPQQPLRLNKPKPKRTPKL